MPFYDLLVVTFILQILGCYSLRKNLSKIEDVELRKGFKVAYNAFLAGLMVQLFVVIMVTLTHLLFKK